MKKEGTKLDQWWFFSACMSCIRRIRVWNSEVQCKLRPIASVPGDPIDTCQEYTNILFYVHIFSFYVYNWINEIIYEDEIGETLFNHRKVVRQEILLIYIKNKCKVGNSWYRDVTLWLRMIYLWISKLLCPLCHVSMICVSVKINTVHLLRRS